MADATVVYTDGACSGNPGPGGWAWVVPDGAWQSGFEAASTNQRMEVTAAWRAVQANPGRLLVRSDSTYVVNCFRDRWYEGWLKRGWLNSARKPVANRDLWEPFIELVLERGDVTFQWVKGHAGDRWNDVADRLAVDAITRRAAAEGSRPPSEEELAVLPTDEVLAAGGGATRSSGSGESDPVAAGSDAAGSGESSTEAAVPRPDPRVPEGRRLVVTGLGAGGLGARRSSVLRKLEEILAAKQKMDPDLLVITGLRQGAERLGAEAARHAGVPYVAVLPWPDPASRWSEGERERFVELLEWAQQAVTLERKVPSAAKERDDSLSRRDGWLARWAHEAIVVHDGSDPASEALLAKLRKTLGEEDVWVIDPTELD